MKIIASTADRVPSHTAPSVNERIRQETGRRIALAAQGGPAAIEQRLQELEWEWDVERCLETGAATLSLTGVLLGATVDRKWYLLPAVVAGFLLQHALQGWCPPLPVFRRLGVRTADEINQERYALKILRGDFAALTPGAVAKPTTSPQAVDAAIDATLNATLH